MKIVFLLMRADVLGGTERAILTQAEYLCETHDVEVISVLKTKGSSFFEIDPRVSVRYLVDESGEVPRPVRPVPLTDDECRRLAGRLSSTLPQTLAVELHLLAEIECAHALRQLDADVVVSSTPALMPLVATCVPDHVATVHQEHRPSYLRGASLDPLMSFAARFDALVVLTQRAQGWLAATLGEAAPRLEVIVNGIPAGYRPRSSRRTRTVSMAGRLHREKQFDHAIEAFGQVAERFGDWTLRIYGTGEEMPRLRQLSESLGLQNQVLLMGGTPHMAQEWAKASVALLSSLDGEAMPLVLLEAFAAGVPAVAYDCHTGPAEIITDGVDGLLVGPDDVDGLAEALAAVIGDDDLRDRFGEHALQAAKRFDMDAVMAQWLDLYQAIAGEPTTTRAQARTDRAARWTVMSGCRGFAPVMPRPDRPLARYLPLEIEQAVRAADPSVVKSGSFLCVVRDDLTPNDVAEANLRLVIDALETSGVPYWVARDRKIRHRVVVAPGDRDSAVKAFASAFGDLPVYAETLRSGGKASAVCHAADLVSIAKAVAAEGLRMFRPVVTSSRTVRMVAACGCDIEFWQPDEDSMVLRPNRRTILGDSVPAQLLRAPARATVADLSFPTIDAFTHNLVDDIDFPVDVVYTWVDGDDPDWLARKNRTLAEHGREPARTAGSAVRFRSRDELRYSLRSIDMYAPWVRKIYLVTDDQRPDWLDDRHPRIEVISHREIFGDAGRLPTFNSHAIETRLHHIPGLSEHFLYFNDDFFLGGSLEPSQFFDSNGVAKFLLSPTSVSMLAAQADDDVHFIAAKNNRRLIRESFGKCLTHSFLHAPYALRRSVLADIEERFPREVAMTAANQFRAPTDISIPSSLHHYVGFFTGCSTRGQLRVAYFNMNKRSEYRRLSKLLISRDQDVFCLNDTHDGDVAEAEQAAVFSAFLESYFPVASVFERGSLRNLAAAQVASPRQREAHWSGDAHVDSLGVSPP